MSACPCASGKAYPDCCGRLHSGAETASTAEALMRSRYSAYVLGLDAWLLATWHPSTRPAALDLAAGPATKWLGLDIRRRQALGDERALVEFVARYRVAGRGHRLHEVSRFVREEGRWYYVDGDVVTP